MSIKRRFMSFSANLICLMIVCFSASFNLCAAVIEGLFDATVPVESQASSIQNKAIKMGMGQVLIKVRGHKDLLKAADIRRGITRATRYVRAYRYEQDDTGLNLVINFDQEKIENLIRTSGYPIWGQRRPDTLIWLAMQNSSSDERQLLRTDDNPEFFQTMTEQAEQRGIKLAFPVWDLNDLQAVSVYDIWGEFAQRITEASQRYGVPSVMSARIYQFEEDAQQNEHTTSELSEFFQDEEMAEIAQYKQKQFKPGQWVADWTSIENGKFVSGQLAVDEFTELGPKLVDAVADILADRYAIDIEARNADIANTQITIINLDSIEAYVQVLEFLQSLSVVNTATLIRQQGNRGTFELTLFGELDDLNNAFNLDRNIHPVLDDFGQPLGNLEFIWRK